MMNPRLEAALGYAFSGWPVFPCREGGKEPATRNGFYDATTDPGRIAWWWGRRPELNIGVATGAPGPDAVDVDVRENGSGFAALNKAARAGLVQGYERLVRTPSTGIHLYDAGSDQRSARLPRQHLDFKGRGGYVIAPPSYAAGAEYVVVKRQPADGTVDWTAIADHLEPQAKATRRAWPRCCTCRNTARRIRYLPPNTRTGLGRRCHQPGSPSR